MITERMIQQRHHGRQVDLEKEKEWDVVESRAGFPPKRILQCLTGALDSRCLVIERDWESLAAMETAYYKAMQDPEWQALNEEGQAYIQSARVEIYQPLT